MLQQESRTNIIYGAASKSVDTLEDERYLPNVYRLDGFAFESGSYAVVNAPGLGLQVDEERYQKSYAGNEIRIKP